MTNGSVTRYRALPFMRWEVNGTSEELVAVRTRVGMNALAVVNDVLTHGGSAEVRTYLTGNYNMPHEGRLIMLLDATLTRMSPSPLDTLPLGEIPL